MKINKRFTPPAHKEGNPCLYHWKIQGVMHVRSFQNISVNRVGVINDLCLVIPDGVRVPEDRWHGKYHKKKIKEFKSYKEQENTEENLLITGKS